MCSIHLDESATYVKSCMAITLYVLSAEKLGSLLDYLGNQRRMHSFQSVAIDCWCRE
jgi:hypothetical protein